MRTGPGFFRFFVDPELAFWYTYSRRTLRHFPAPVTDSNQISPVETTVTGMRRGLQDVSGLLEVRNVGKILILNNIQHPTKTTGPAFAEKETQLPEP